MLKFERVPYTPEWWESTLQQFPDWNIYQTAPWLTFLAETQGGEIITAALLDGNSTVGYFSGLVVKKFGLRLLGSPLPGWTTIYMGFNLMPEVPRWLAFEALERFAFRDLGCQHFEVADRYGTAEDGKRAGLEQRFFNTYRTDLTKTEQNLFDELDPMYRRCIRKAERCKVVIEEAIGDDAFAVEFYEHVKDVFRSKRQPPMYPGDWVTKFIHYLGPTDHLALFRARDADGRCIATCISHGMNGFAQLWGTASLRKYQHLRPNQAMHWHALRYWRNRGAQCFDWGGDGEYKKRYATQKITVHRFCKSSIPFLSKLRDYARVAFIQQRLVKGWWEQSAARKLFVSPAKDPR
ncbi:MAG: GNAT family N-acetyltransferase [Candidatus Angelobacter sp.]